MSLPIPSLGLLANPWVILAIVVGLAASHTAVGMWQRSDGAAQVEARYATLEVERQKAGARLRALQEAERRAKEEADRKQLYEIGVHNANELLEAERRRRADVAAVRAGAIRLRDPGAPAGSCPAPVPGAPGPAAQRDDSAPGQLSGAAAEFLLQFAGDADEVAGQLADCQAVVTVLTSKKGASP